MTKTALADRAARSLLSLLGALNLMFFAAFLCALLLAAESARASDLPVCAGSDMLARMAAEDPDGLARLREDARKVPNGQGLLWRIDRPGVAPSYLMGTMHVTDPRVLDLGSAAQAAFDEARTLVIETTDVLDPAKMTAAMATRPELMMFMDGTTLTGLLAGEDRALVEKGLEKRGISLTAVQTMKPWIISALVSLPACELQRKSAGAAVLDIELAQRAKDAGKQVAGLETMFDQLEAMASLPMDLHIRGLVDTLKLADRIDDLTETMVVIYRSGETGMFWPFFRTVLPEEGRDEDGFAAFQEAMVDKRNAHMAEAVGPILDRGNAFIAVGALHLSGEKGLVALLRAKGYRLSPVEAVR